MADVDDTQENSAKQFALSMVMRNDQLRLLERLTELEKRTIVLEEQMKRCQKVPIKKDVKPRRKK